MSRTSDIRTTVFYFGNGLFKLKQSLSTSTLSRLIPVYIDTPEKPVKLKQAPKASVVFIPIQTGVWPRSRVFKRNPVVWMKPEAAAERVRVVKSS